MFLRLRARRWTTGTTRKGRDWKGERRLWRLSGQWESLEQRGWELLDMYHSVDLDASLPVYGGVGRLGAVQSFSFVSPLPLIPSPKRTNRFYCSTAKPHSRLRVTSLRDLFEEARIGFSIDMLHPAPSPTGFQRA